MANRPKTALGTPCAQTWDDPWFRRVDTLEHQLDRRICGAHAPDGEPCQLTSKHPNGRCRFHGGHPRIGAQKGNTNALVHGLYSRRLRQCGDKCPLWTACPFAGPDVLDLPETKRPICIYEQQAYDTISSKGKDETKPANATGGSAISTPPDDPIALAVKDTTALLYVMLNRAATTLSVLNLTDRVEATGDHYSMNSTKVSAALTAFLRISREFRAYLTMHDLIANAAAQSPLQNLPLKDDKDCFIPYDATGRRLGLPDIMQPLVQEARDTGFAARYGYYRRRHDARLHRRKKALGISDPGDPLHVAMPPEKREHPLKLPPRKDK